MVSIIRLFILSRFKPLDDPYGTPTNSKVLDATNIDDPLRQGAETFSQGVGGIKKPAISGFEDAQNTLLGTIQNATNRVLGFLALAALIYLIIQGIQLLVQPKDDEVKKIWTRITNTAWALGGIGLSWMIISFIFRIINQFVG